MPPQGTIDALGSIVTLPGGMRACLPSTGSELYCVYRYRPVIALSVTRMARDTSPRRRGKDALKFGGQQTGDGSLSPSRQKTVPYLPPKAVFSSFAFFLLLLI